MARRVAVAVLAVSAGALGTAFTAELVFGLEPCILCLYQRVPYGITGALAVMALVVRPKGRMVTAFAALCGVVFLFGAFLAAYHVGVEEHWWNPVTACGGGVPAAMSVDQLRASLLAPPPKACDVVEWRLWGISMAGYNAVASTALAAVLGLVAWRKRRDWA